jgi:hypothetical protein
VKMDVDHALVRYLEAKRTVDDRSFSRRVREILTELLPPEPQIIDIGAGTGATVPRLLDLGIGGSYRGIDSSEQLTAYAHAVRSRELRFRDFEVTTAPEYKFTVSNISGTDTDTDTNTTSDAESSLDVVFETDDALAAASDADDIDLLMAQQFMDLVPIERALGVFLDALRPGGLAYFPLTFDGTTVFQPDHPADDAVETAYHDAIDAVPDRDSHAGRHLLDILRNRPGAVRAVDAADAVVYPQENRYTGDEQYYLQQLLTFVEETVTSDAVPEIDDWLASRRQQISDGVLSYVGHRYDILYQTSTERS